MTSQDSAKGTISVDDVDPMGKYICLMNKSNEDQLLTDWELYIQVNYRKPLIHKFDNCDQLWAGGSRTFKWNQKFWDAGDQLLVTLYSDTGELKAHKMLELEDFKSITLEQDSRSQDSAEGTIDVDNVNLIGKYVRLIIKSKKLQQLRGWKLHLMFKNNKTIKHTLEDCYLDQGDTLTVKLRLTSLDAEDQLNAVDHLQVILYSDTGKKMFKSDYKRKPPAVKDPPTEATLISPKKADKH
ncbi:uncharacterized protein LOC131989144 [Centropristis striata]|uniref:uncharacterized protein LOC131989144 n=1 Tax=Centropristis striata TaxID=184440 RepID=UPI0027E0BFA3|nr:uncharacterized protein LOC131989144 [Centropristis striata]